MIKIEEELKRNSMNNELDELFKVEDFVGWLYLII